MKLIYIFFFVILCNTPLVAQQLTSDYLSGLADEELLSIFNELYRDSIQQEKVARTYLDRARKEKDTIKMARGYDRLARIFHPKKNLMFADSVISLTKNLNNITYPGMGYILKAYSFDKMDELEDATKNFLLAHSFAVKNNNLSQQIYITDFLIFYKAVWGNKQDALELQKQRNEIVFSDEYFESLLNDSRKNSHLDVNQLHLQAKILSLQNYSFCYLNLRKIDSARFFANQAILLNEKYDLYDRDELQNWSEEILLEIEYYDRNFQSTVTIASNLLLKDAVKKSPSSLKNVYLFKGLSLNELGEAKDGLKLLLISDSIYNKNRDIKIQPYDRILYEELLEHYKSNRNKAKSIQYLNKLILLDSLFKIKYKYFEPAMIKNFETPKLLEEKEVLIKDLERKNDEFRAANGFIVVVLIFCFILLMYYFHRQRIYKNRFDYMLASPQSLNSLNSPSREGRSEISPKLIEEIMQKLHRFEEQQGFRDSNLSLQTLAITFGTNSNYLSRVVNLKMERNFSTYIHDLRLDFAIKELLVNKKFRRYTIKAIAEECGYTNAESFSRAFYRKHGIYPSYYIKKLNKTAN